MRRSALLLITLLSASLAPSLAADRLPDGWFLAGDHPQDYTVGSDGNGVEYLASKADSNGDGFGTLMHVIRADEYAAKRVRFSAMVRSENLSGWAGLWMRVDAGKKVVAFDNMQGRPIKGTNGWTKYEVVLNVPINATSISYGALMGSNGEIWMSHVSLEAVNSNVPTTGSWPP